MAGCKNYIKIVPPDGGWGWLVALGAYIITFLGPMTMTVYSILYSKMLRDGNATSTKSAMIFNLSQTMWSISCIFSPHLCAEFGCRRVAMVGSLIIGFGVIISSFASQPEFLFFSYSLLVGIGCGIAMPVWQFIIPQYFEKRRGRVIGIVTSGICVSQFLPLLLTKLQEEYGARGAILIVGALMLNMCVGASLYHPVEWHARKTNDILDFSDANETNNGIIKAFQEELRPSLVSNNHTREDLQIRQSARNSFIRGSLSSLASYSPYVLERDAYSAYESKIGSQSDFPSCCKTLQATCSKFSIILKLSGESILLFKSLRVIIITFSQALIMVANSNMFMLIPFAITSRNYSLQVAAKGITILGACNLTSRIVNSSLTDILPFRSKWLFMAGTLLTSASILSFSFADDEPWIYISLGFYGVGIGCCISLFVTVIIETVGLEMLPSTFGARGLLRTISFPIIGLIIGYLRDSTQNYDICLQFLCVIPLVSFVLVASLPLAIKLDKRRLQNVEEVE